MQEFSILRAQLLDLIKHAP